MRRRLRRLLHRAWHVLVPELPRGSPEREIMIRFSIALAFIALLPALFGISLAVWESKQRNHSICVSQRHQNHAVRKTFGVFEAAFLKNVKPGSPKEQRIVALFDLADAQLVDPSC